MSMELDPACTGKTRYPSRGSAMARVHQKTKRHAVKLRGGRHGLHAYRCASCGSWHIGSSAL